MEVGMYSVYALTDPRTKKVHYIGSTLDVKRRLNDHLSNKKGNAKKRAWIEDLKRENLLPALVILEDGLKEPDVWVREAHWIQQYVKLKAPLTNTHFPNPDKTIKRHKCIYVTFSQKNYDYLVSLGRKAELKLI
jgi:hypothetical protein